MIPSIIALIGLIDIFYGYPGISVGIIKRKKIEQLEYLSNSNKSNELVALLRSIKENPTLADEYFFYTGRLRIDNPGAYPEGPRIFFENIKPNSFYYDRSLKQHLKYISNIQRASSRYNEIEYFQKYRLQGNPLNEYYYIAELYNLIWSTPDKSTISYSHDYEQWRKTLNNFRETYYFVYFAHFPFRWSITQAKEGAFNMHVTPELIMSVTTVEFILQIGLFMSSENQPISIQKNHLLRLKIMLKPPSNLVYFDSSYIANNPKVFSGGAKIDLAVCLENYGLSHLMQFAEKLIQIKTSQLQTK